MDFLSDSRVQESTQELENYWPVMAEFKKTFTTLMDNIQITKDSVEMKSQEFAKVTQVIIVEDRINM